jgi:hypothetical protein
MKKTDKTTAENYTPVADAAQLSLDMTKREDRAFDEARAAGMTTPITLVGLAKIHELLDYLDTNPEWREQTDELRTILPARPTTNG